MVPLSGSWVSPSRPKENRTLMRLCRSQAGMEILQWIGANVASCLSGRISWWHVKHEEASLNNTLGR
jgi:hypothetical protein